MILFLAGVIIGDQRAPYKRDIERFSAATASLGRIVAFTVSRTSVSLQDVLRSGGLGIGRALAGLLILIIRPTFVGLLITPIRLRWGERAFILLAGLRRGPDPAGHVILSAGPDDASRIYSHFHRRPDLGHRSRHTGAYLAALLHVPMRRSDPEPWGIGLRSTDEPRGLHRHIV